MANFNKVDLVKISETETGLNNVLMDKNTGRKFTNEEAYKKSTKNYAGVWDDYIPVENNKGTKFVKTTQDKKEKLN